MDFDDTPEEAAFRIEARRFLDANATRRKPGQVEAYRRGIDATKVLAGAKDFQRRKCEAGFVGLHWPVDWGGRGGSPIQTIIYNQEESKYDVLSALFNIGVNMSVPTICTWGTPAQKERYVRPCMRGDEIWCQLFSEPGGGSDLAALRTRAEQRGDEWIVNGQKIWNSGAHYADFGILVARSNPDVPKHQGLTYFLLDMKTPGVEVRPIKQISGTSHFNEVFFTDVRIPDSCRLGPVGGGWKVALTTLMNERHGVRDSTGPDADELLRLAQEVDTENGPAIDDPAVQEKIADIYVRSQGLKFTKFRGITALSRGQNPGPESSIIKFVAANKLQEVLSFGLDLIGMAGPEMMPDSPLAGAFEEALLYAPSLRIAGGTDEIMKNIIAERVLGLPQDPRVDKNVPFRDIPGGGRS
ncbi:acyl-CoA dehydrogenase family protein [Rhodopila sp.]|uniref:acyl-CoA dehydrogenase family protein n=1 Tax=Rhodopila sp. TaxID=2480087 RepID=UPI002CB2297F|nr:acyl-CoA dehydrogenase family protein [Rhodopila sp.]HVZ08023.1 acyl-CoA dehydrogenase family protein [Rhodopila sp.]